MKRVGVIAALSVCAAAYSADITLTPAEDAHCTMQGGCHFVTDEWLRGQIRAAYEAGRKESAERCRRPMT
jgi:hypothetical protein